MFSRRKCVPGTLVERVYDGENISCQNIHIIIMYIIYYIILINMLSCFIFSIDCDIILVVNQI